MDHDNKNLEKYYCRNAFKWRSWLFRAVVLFRLDVIITALMTYLYMTQQELNQLGENW